jgi:hypothetical protein
MLGESVPEQSPRDPMVVAVSPYHLTTREPPAMAALLLAERVVTMLPAPVDQADIAQAHTAAGEVPAYLAFMKSWTWTAPLWRAGVLAAELDGQSAVADMHEVFTQVSRDHHLAPLRHFMHEGIADDEHRYLNAVAADVLKGGPDPGISIPVIAGLDRFATRHQLLVARPQPTSVVQVNEAKVGLSLGAVAVPVLLQADADRILHAREVMSDVLEDLWTAYANLDQAACELEGGVLVSPGVPAQEAAEVTKAAAAYATAYESRREDITDDSESDEVRLVEGTARVAAIRMPTDVVLRSSLAAVAGLRKQPPNGQAPAGLVPFDPLTGRCFVSLMIKPLGSAPARRR